MFQHQESSLDTLIVDQIEPLNEEMSLPAVGSQSIPAVEELDPIVEQVEKSQTPVVEETIIATHTYCTGCPTDIDVSNPALQEYVDQALAVIDEGSRGKYMHRATRIAKAQKQVRYCPLYY
jgi:predicted aldo/keto reductase-like oxidoreductase